MSAAIKLLKAIKDADPDNVLGLDQLNRMGWEFFNRHALRDRKILSPNIPNYATSRDALKRERAKLDPFGYDFAIAGIEGCFTASLSRTTEFAEVDHQASLPTEELAEFYVLVMANQFEDEVAKKRKVKNQPKIISSASH